MTEPPVEGLREKADLLERAMARINNGITRHDDATKQMERGADYLAQGIAALEARAEAAEAECDALRDRDQLWHTVEAARAIVDNATWIAIIEEGRARAARSGGEGAQGG